jgi:hypothetical protein
LTFSAYAYQDKLNVGQVRYQPPTATGTCSFTYSVYASGNSGQLESNTATVTITVVS